MVDASLYWLTSGLPIATTTRYVCETKIYRRLFHHYLHRLTQTDTGVSACSCQELTRVIGRLALLLSERSNDFVDVTVMLLPRRILETNPMRPYVCLRISVYAYSYPIRLLMRAYSDNFYYTRSRSLHFSPCLMRTFHRAKAIADCVDF